MTIERIDQSVCRPSGTLEMLGIKPSTFYRWYFPTPLKLSESI
jgi:hypothetical protein